MIRLNSIAALAAQGRWRTEAMRSHATLRLLWFSRGQGRIVLGGQTRGYGPNNLIYIPAGTLHGYEAGTGTHGIEIVLTPDLAKDWPDEPVHMRFRDADRQRELTMLVENLERELTSDDPTAPRAAEMHAGLLAVFVERQIALTPDQGLPATAASRLVQAYSALIARDFHLSKTVGEYAAELGVTATHLTRACRKACNRSALSLLNDRVLYDARKRLQETRTPIARIASDLGFSSAAYFTRAFSANTGQSPSAFRKAAAERTGSGSIH